MKQSHLLGAVSAFTLAVLANTAQAAVFNPILGLDIGGTLYDVTFHDSAGDSFNALWDADDDGVFGGGASVFSASPTFWGDEPGAYMARDAIIQHLGNTNTTTSISDSFAIPYRVIGSSQDHLTEGPDEIRVATDSYTEPDLEWASGASTTDSNLVQYQHYPYASFKLSETLQPIPFPWEIFMPAILHGSNTQSSAP